MKSWLRKHGFLVDAEGFWVVTGEGIIIFGLVIFLAIKALL